MNDRLQVFTKQGKFVKEFFVRPQTLGRGSFWQFTFSIDENQKYLLVADGENNVIWTLRREDGAVVAKRGTTAATPASFTGCTRSFPTRKAISTPGRSTPANGFRNSFCSTRFEIRAELTFDVVRASFFAGAKRWQSRIPS